MTLHQRFQPASLPPHPAPLQTKRANNSKNLENVVGLRWVTCDTRWRFVRPTLLIVTHEAMITQRSLLNKIVDYRILFWPLLRFGLLFWSLLHLGLFFFLFFFSFSFLLWMSSTFRAFFFSSFFFGCLLHLGLLFWSLLHLGSNTFRDSFLLLTRPAICLVELGIALLLGLPLTFKQNQPPLRE